jgi:hypothetical protein
MKWKWIVAVIFLISAFGIVYALSDEPLTDEQVESYESWGDYWYQGKAELTSYTLEQARYGEIRKGEAVLIFVTEDFSKEKQVKLDNPSEVEDDEKVKVLKLNQNRKFITGIYPYSLMASIFTPVKTAASLSKTLKATASTQEWCGQTFIQLNLDENDYRVQSYSYFESEGDRTKLLDGGMLEDELWNMIRIEPKNIPTGEVQLVPSLFYIRLMHIPVKNYTATIQKSVENNEAVVRVDYTDIDRSFTIYYSTTFPYEIIGWEERYTSGFGQDKKELITRATKKERILLDYWNFNAIEDEDLRDKLELINN